MASTYSDLKIELIGTGEQVGTWGATTNTNLGTAIEEAITGSADVTFSSADVTLTLTNTNGTQAARNLRLVCTGTSGGARNLILGSGCQINKLYLVQNNLTDAVTIKNTTGTGVVVPAGQKRFVFNDGVNVVEAASSTINLTSDVTGTLPIANGGTGTTSTQFVNLSTNVTGTLPIANGGTGATTNTVARTNLGLGTMATQAANNVAITGGSIAGITDLAVADGGTGASSFTANNVLLGNGTSAFQVVAPGTSGNALVSNGSTWISSTPALPAALSTASGSAPSYSARAWVNFDGSATPPSIRASGNVSSVARNSNSDFTINFTTSMGDVNYGWAASAGQNNVTQNLFVSAPNSVAFTTWKTAGALRIRAVFGNLNSDTNPIDVSIATFR
jgi:hypothetical protein